jgi:hypothetical protein
MPLIEYVTLNSLIQDKLQLKTALTALIDEVQFIVPEPRHHVTQARIDLALAALAACDEPINP